MERQANPAVKWGLIFGGLLIVLDLINLGIEYATGTLSAAASATTLASMHLGAVLAQACLVFLIEAALFFVAGMLTAQENGRIGSSAIAGVIAGALGGVVSAVITLITRFTQPEIIPVGANMSPATYHSFLLVVTIVGVVLGLAIAIGIGAGIAALGGLVGRGRYERTHIAPPMAESYYTPTAPMTGQPPTGAGAGYPPAPGMYPPPPQYPPQQYPPQQYPPQQYPPQQYPPQQ